MHFFLARTKIVNQNITQSIAMYSIKVVSKKLRENANNLF